MGFEIEVDSLEQMCDLMCGDYDLISRQETIEAITENITDERIIDEVIAIIKCLPGRGTE